MLTSMLPALLLPPLPWEMRRVEALPLPVPAPLPPAGCAGCGPVHSLLAMAARYGSLEMSSELARVLGLPPLVPDWRSLPAGQGRHGEPGALHPSPPCPSTGASGGRPASGAGKQASDRGSSFCEPGKAWGMVGHTRGKEARPGLAAWPPAHPSSPCLRP